MATGDVADGLPGGTADRANIAFIIAIVAVATIGGFMFGYDSGVINGTQDGLEKAFHLSKLGTGLNVGAMLLGCAVGAFVAGRLSDLIGRRSVMIIAAGLFVISALAAGAADSSALFILARILGGFGVGAASILAPAYISEVAPADMRGRLTSTNQIMIITGLTGAFLANYLLAATAGGSTSAFWLGLPAWRWMFWMQVVPAGVFLLALLMIPESPRYLIAKGRDEKARLVLSRLFGIAQAERKADEIRASLAADHHRPTFKDLIDRTTGRVRPIVWTGIGLAAFQQLVGINVVFYYGAVLWQSVGFSENDALKINVLTGTFSIAGCMATILLVDRIGRKPLLLIGSVGMAVTLGVMALSFATGMPISRTAGTAALIAAIAYVVFFNLSWGPIMWVLLGEMFPNQIRGSGLAIAGFAQWITNFGIIVSFPALAGSLGLPLTYAFYAASAAVSLFFVRVMVHETRGRELEDMVG